MKIKADIIADFIKKLAGKIDETVLDFSENLVTCRGTNASNVMMLEVQLDKKAFLEYKSVGEVAISNVIRLNEITQRFEGTISLTTENNMLVIGNDSRQKL